MAENWDRFVSVTTDWKHHAAEFDKLVQPSEMLRAALKASGGPADLPEPQPSISPDLTRWAVLNCFLMRNRFNLVDLLDMMGLWTEERIEWALADVMEPQA